MWSDSLPVHSFKDIMEVPANWWKGKCNEDQDPEKDHKIHPNQHPGGLNFLNQVPSTVNQPHYGRRVQTAMYTTWNHIEEDGHELMREPWLWFW